jgi:hypothetical protein
MLEARAMLSITPGPVDYQALIEQGFVADFHGPDGYGKDGPLSKVGTDLTLLYNEFKVHQQYSPSVPFVGSHGDWMISNGQVAVDALTRGNATLFQQQIVGIGGTVVVQDDTFVSALVPIGALPQLAQIANLQFARPVYRPVTHAGTVLSQGDASMRTDLARQQFTVDGTGVKIGVLSDSYNTSDSAITAAIDIANGELPANVQIVQEGPADSSDEGRAMLQLIHDAAPGADLAFASAFVGGEAGFAQNIRRLAQAGSDVIVDDVGYFAEPFFQDGRIAQAIDEVASQGVAYFSSAGNSGSEAYQSEFRDSGVDLLVNVNGQQVNAGRLHDFDDGAGVATTQTITVQPGGLFRISFQWDQPFGSLGGAGSQNDLDLYLIDENGEVVSGSFDVNFGGDPWEFLVFQNFSLSTTFSLGIVVFPRSGTSPPAASEYPGLMKYINVGFGSEISSFATNTGASWGHSTSAGGAGVGAAAFYMTPAFGQSPPLLNEFSSGGGSPYLFTTTGTRLSQPEIRDQPRFTGPDGTNTSFFGSDVDYDADDYPNFYGTSASAPHVAALAALMVERAGGPGRLSPDEIYTTLEETAIDITLRQFESDFPDATPIPIEDGVGFDYFSGHGLVNATAAIAATPAPPRAIADSALTTENASVTINVLGNDLVGSSGSPLVPSSVTIVAPPTAGTVSVNTLTGEVLYTPGDNFAGSDTFSYRMTDLAGVISNIAPVTVRVNRPPVAVDDSVKTITETPIDINVLANDTDSDSGGGLDVTSVTIVSPPSNGVVSVNPTTGVVTYTPNAGFAGNDLFTYTVEDNDGAVSNVAQVSVFVNAPPVANDDSGSTLPGVPVTIAVLANDFDPTPGGGLVPSSVTIVSPPTNGTALVNVTNGFITYTPVVGFSGTETFTYTVFDVDGAVSNEATVSIAVNSPPIAIDDAVNTPVNVAATVLVVDNDFDPDPAGGIAVDTVQIVQQPKNGTAVTDSSGNIIYTPNSGFQGGDIVKYTVQDDTGAVSNVATVIFRVGNLHTVGGQVYVDLNGDLARNGTDWPIAGVTVWLTSNDPNFPFTDLVETDANGLYQFTNVVTGSFTISEQHPGFFVDGPEVNNSLLPVTVGNDVFSAATFSGGGTFTGFDFTEKGVRAEFVAAYFNRRTFFSTGGGVSLDSLNLGAGDVWVAVDGGILGEYQASAFAASGGSVTMTLYDTNMQQVKRSTTGLLSYTANSSNSYFLKVTGTASQASVNSYVIKPTPVVNDPPPPSNPAPPTTPNPPTDPTPPPVVQWSNPANAMDVDGNGLVEPRDLLLVIDALNRYGAGSLITRTIASSHYLDVNGEDDLTPRDALLIIDHLNRHAVQFGVAAESEFSEAAEDVASHSATGVLSSVEEHDVAFALALNGALEEEMHPLLSRKRK